MAVLETLTMDGLVAVTEEIEPYVLTLSDAEEDGEKEAKVLVVMKRPGGVLLAVPEGFIDRAILDAGQEGGADLIFGPSVLVQVPGVVLDNGVVAPTGTAVHAVLVDCSSAVLASLRLPSIFEEIAANFDPDDPYALPGADGLVSAAMDWIPQVSGLANFYTAESSVQSTPRRGRRNPRERKEPVLPTQEETPTMTPKPKKATTASLAEGVDSIMKTLPALTSQIQELSDRQQLLEQRMMVPTSGIHATLSQPLGKSIESRQASLGALAATAKAPPKTSNRQPSGLLGATTFRQEEVEELNKEKPLHQEEPGDPLARAVLEQSKALTALIGQISQSTLDPMADLGSASGVGSRGSTGRAKLQQELASQKGLFFNSVVQSMARRMSPTSPTEMDTQVLLSRGVSGTRYLERFGGYGRHRELGQLQFQAMTVLDFMMSDNGPAARDALALLVVALEQMVLDNGRMEIASLITLQEDPPASIFTNRQVLATSRGRSFAPLADQKWITVALAYLKEMDLIAAKRVEFTGGKGSTVGGEDVAPKVKATPKKKGQGRGRQQQQQQEEEA